MSKKKKDEPSVRPAPGVHEWQVLMENTVRIFFSERLAKLYVESIRLTWPGPEGGVFAAITVRHIVRYHESEPKP